MNKSGSRIGLAIVTFLVFIAAWQTYIVLFKLPTHVLPSPLILLNELIRYFQEGIIYNHIYVTLYEIGVGILIGTILGLASGYLLAKSQLLERIVTPYIVLMQTIPKISIAPLFLLWFGLGAESKIALVILVVFFPIMVNFVVGIRSVESNMKDLLSILKTNRWQKFIAVELPYSLPAVMSGMKVATTYAITGAVIGEMIGAKAGLGYLVILGSETYDIGMILIAVLLLSIIGLLLYLIVDILEKKLLTWHESQEMIL
jgi:NitT/TauT family transport system permease protein